MILFALNDAFQEIYAFDVFESLIWTQRYSAIGDFEFKIATSNRTRSQLKVGTWVAVSDGGAMMCRIETKSEELDDYGREITTITGRDALVLTQERVARQNFDNLEETETWTLTGQPATIMRNIFNYVCRDGNLAPEDIIPRLTSVFSPWPGPNPLPTEIITVEFKPQSVYDILKEIADAYNIGFKLVRVNTDLWFYVWAGLNRTTSQTINAPVVFDSNFNNIVSVRELTSIVDNYNVAYVFSKAGFEMVHDDSIAEGVSGFDRKVLYLEATNIGPDYGTPEEISEALKLFGKMELAKYRQTYAIDGEIPQFGVNVGYALGDMVEMRSADGTVSNMRVTEKITVSDAQGDRTYPTLTADRFILPGTWEDLKYAYTFWDDAEGTWDEQ